jgi:aminoglycoside 6'-N-acetyltransferase
MLRAQITFTDLGLPDLTNLQIWLNRPHLRRFFQKTSISRDEVRAKYGPRIRGDEPSRCHLAWHGQSPFAYLQCYRLADWPEWAKLVGTRDGACVDFAIFEPHMIGKGFGHAMLSNYLRSVVFQLYPDEGTCFVAHESQNQAAIACSRAAGFRYVRAFLEDGLETMLFVFDRDKSGETRG